MKNQIALCLALFLLFFLGCHPFFMFNPPSIKASAIKPKQSQVANIAVDSFGVPFIKAQNQADAMYALGYMHARDRLFQLDMVRHAALGRAAELFGKKALSFDKKMRLLSYRLLEQQKYLSKNELEIIEAYVAGVNHGAKERGRSAEHFLLGAHFEEFSVLDVIAIGRLQAWQLAADLTGEIARLKIARSEKISLAQKNELLAPVDDSEAAIIAGNYAQNSGHEFRWPNYLFGKKNPDNKITVGSQFSPVQSDGGASNAWAVSGDLSENNQAILMNDPHLRHAWPSNFYLATVEASGFKASGASFVGLPAILIGASDYLAWGVTASYLNTQDSVLLARDEKEPLAYLVDGKKHDLQKWPQRFCLNKKGDCQEEIFYTSIFGPVMDSSIEPELSKEDLLAVMWSGFLVEKHQDIVLGFMDLAQSQNVEDAKNVVVKMSFPGVNLLMADINGDIAYSYAGLVPKKDLEQHPYLPLDGGKSTSLWQDFWPKPQLLKPQQGYIVTANQNIFSFHADEKSFFGQHGAAPFRALQINNQLSKLKKSGQAYSLANLKPLQLDAMSLEAKGLAPKLGAICSLEFEKQSKAKQSFANEIKNFDGLYSKESLGALPYEILVEKVLLEELNSLFGENEAKPTLHYSGLDYKLKLALAKKLNNENTALFNADTIEQTVKNACLPAFEALVEKAGTFTSSWRWGRHHYLQRQSPLAQAPIVGKLFKDKKRETAGSSSSPLAESGTPVIYGANLRLQAQMSIPPKINVVLDSGNSGAVGHKNSLDQAKLWHEGKVFPMVTNWQQALKEAPKSFVLGK